MHISFTDSHQHSGSLLHRIDYDLNEFYRTGPSGWYYKQVTIVMTVASTIKLQLGS
jgi:hypothetical protein